MANSQARPGIPAARRLLRRLGLALLGKTRYNSALTTKRAGTNRPFFLVARFWSSKLWSCLLWGCRVFCFFRIDLHNVALQQIAEETVTGFGYDLVEIERSAGGLLRITIDLPWQVPQAGVPPAPEQYITVEDCEKVTRQLQFALEVDGVEYQRLEVSSPGIDRPLRHEQDYQRFEGQVIDLVLKQPMGVAAAGQVSPLRKKFRGTLERAEQGAWQITWRDEPVKLKPGQRVSAKRVPPPLQALGFTLDELKEARLAPLVNFKGRGTKPSSE